MRRSPLVRDDREISYGALLDAVRGLRWRARRASRKAVPGVHPSRVRGTSAEFTEYRPYRQGDDLKRIDWKLFARSDRAHIRISEERAVTPTMILLDASASMAFPDGAGSKWTLARQLCVALASIAHSSADPVGLAIAGSRALTLQPRTRRGIVAEIINAVGKVSPSGSASVADVIVSAARSAARIVIVSDFLGDGEESLRRARELSAAGRDVHALHVIAAEEIDPGSSLSVVVDSEDPGLRRSLSSETRRAYLSSFAAWRESTAAAWLASGAAYHTVIARQEPVSHAVRRIVRDEASLITAEAR